MSKRIAIIGAGMSGLSCASRLRELGHEVVIFEKSRGVSGRISTRQLAHGNCDHGAQYITATSPGFRKVLENWKSRGLVDRWSPRISVIGGSESREPASVDRYVGTPRMTSPLAALSKEFDVRPNLRVHSLEQHPAGWILKSEEGIAMATDVHAVVFAIPAPQAVELLGRLMPLWRETAANVEMAPCWTVMATLLGDQETPFDAAFVNSGPLSWVANNASKPGRLKTPLWTLHASAAWTSEHLHDDPKEVTKALVEAFENITQQKVAESIVHRWRYAKAAPDTNQGYLWDSALGLAACGDWLVGGNVEGAWQSGQACANACG